MEGGRGKPRLFGFVPQKKSKRISLCCRASRSGETTGARWTGRGVIAEAALSLQFTQDFCDGLVTKPGPFVRRGYDQVLGLEETGEAGGGEAHDAHQAEHLGEGVEVFAELDEATEVDPQNGDFVVEAGEATGLEVEMVKSFELAGVEAVLEGVSIAGLGAGGTGGFGLGMHVSFVAQMFGVVKC